MTEISSFRPNAVPQLTPDAPLAVSIPLTNGHKNDEPETEQDEAESTIKCVCRWKNDDGFTVFCELCKTWQHAACYYGGSPEAPPDVPEIHECADCNPRSIKSKTLEERLRHFHDVPDTADKKPKKPAPKSHKKKIKDHPTLNTQSNGWNSDQQQNRKSGSPRDFPPAKRHKSSHKPSPSLSTNTALNLAPSRKRAGSTLAIGQSPNKSPPTPQPNESPADYFSPEFLQLYRGEEPSEVSENVYGDISLASDLLQWLEDPDLLAEVTDGMKPTELFQRLPGSIDELEGMAPKIEKHVDQNTMEVKGVDPPPIFQWLTVDSPVEYEQYIGELRGMLERKDAYISDPANRWQTLRHPEPFVFFPPYLPLVVDARKQGSLMRYVRRSCDPNLDMRIFIADRRYHFCFVAARDIEAGEELTIRWDLDADIARYVKAETMNGNVAEKGIQHVDQLSSWVAGALANFGGCACNRAPFDCLLQRAHRRNGQYSPTEAPARKGSKPKRTKKQQISPISTGHATNSRAGSETLNRTEHDDDNADTRSFSGSSRSKPASRDNTPLTAPSLVDGHSAPGTEPSDRETRKLMQLHRLFEQKESEEHHGHKRKKRNSAGSTINTPSMLTSKQLGHPEPSPPSRRSATTYKKTPKRQVIQRLEPRPMCQDNATQTDQEPPNEVIPPPKMIFPRYVSNTRLFLERMAKQRTKRENDMEASRLSQSAQSSPTSGIRSSSSKASSSPAQDFKSSTTSTSSSTQLQESKEDVDMKDIENEPIPVPENHTDILHKDMNTSRPETQSQQTKETDTSDSTNIESNAQKLPAARPTDLHVALPPPLEYADPATTTTPLTTTPGSLGPLPPPLSLSPSETSQPVPSPARKKLSLSDYTRRRANATKPSDSGISQAEPSTLSTSDSVEAAKDVEMKDAVSTTSAATEMGPPKAPASNPPLPSSSTSE